MTAVTDKLDALREGYSAPLTTHVLGYGVPNTIGTRVLPLVSFPTDTVHLPLYGKDAFRKVSAKRALRAVPDVIQLARELKSFSLDEHALGAQLDVKEMEAARESDLPWDIAAAHAVAAKRMVILQREYEIATLCQTSGSFASSTTVLAGAGWNEFTNGVSNVDPLPLIEEQINTLRSNIGTKPNVAFCGISTARALRYNTQVHDRLFGVGNPGNTSLDMIANWLGLDEIVVGDGVYLDPDTNAMVDIWGDCFGLIYRVGAPSQDPTPTFGFTAIRSFGNVGDQEVLGFSVEWKPSPYVYQWDYIERVKPHVAMSDAGYLFLDVCH